MTEMCPFTLGKRACYLDQMEMSLCTLHRPYVGAVGEEFFLMDGNVRPRQVGLIEEYLEDQGLERMNWPAQSQGLNPVKSLGLLFGTTSEDRGLLLVPLRVVKYA
ncbi:hypothetical protein AVEN_212238-1 [Araneus ventricosus]|uniref:Uncharacterized protein n=1 Tax=Araneus ventricosus TaxID=182803 RepID=A0A4Y2EMX8_ARAVE|nr:hypothetical protein AVEN_212238-1 [Araneus ventricosus]